MPGIQQETLAAGLATNGRKVKYPYRKKGTGRTCPAGAGLLPDNGIQWR